MSPNTIFAPMGAHQLREMLETLSYADLIALTLTDADVLLGGVAKFWKWDGNVLSFSFNTPKGKRFGDSWVVDVPINLIAGVLAVPLSEASIPRLERDDFLVQLLEAPGAKELGIEFDTRLPIQDYPNPLASIMYEHNTGVAAAHGLEVYLYVEKALAKDGIPPEGIRFDGDFLIYADWAFFATQAGGGIDVSVAPVPGLISIGKHISQSPEEQVLQRLKGSLAAKVRQRISPSIGNYQVLQGCLRAPEPAQTDIIEGEECHLYRIAARREELGTYPVLIKVKQLKYPSGFLEYITSILTFYGEIMTIPTSVVGETYHKALLARAIGYLHEN